VKARWREAGSLVVACFTGWLVWRLWALLGLPAGGDPGDAPFPGLWRWFFAVWLPALYPAFTIAHVRLARRVDLGPAWQATRSALIWDQASYAGLLFFLGAMVEWHRFGDWRLVLGAVYVGLLFAKVLGLVVTVYAVFGRAADPDGETPLPGLSDESPRELPLGLWPLPDEARPEASWFPAEDTTVAPLEPSVPAEPAATDDSRVLTRTLFWTALFLYGFLAPYVITAVSTAGDEHVYLLDTVSLLTDRDVDIANNAAQGDYAQFYWGRATPERWQGRFVGFPSLLLPGYALLRWALPHYPLAGRLGATWTIALFAALLTVQVYRLCRELGLSRPAALWGWIVLALTPPVLTNASHIYPELPAAWAVVWGVRALRRVPVRPWRALAGVAAAAAFVVLLKTRYASLSVGLLGGAAAALIVGRAIGPLVVLGAGTVAAVGVLLGTRLRALLSLVPPWPKLVEAALHWDRYRTVALIGLFADQEFGLLFHAPHYVLAAVGLPLMWRRRPRAALALVGLVGFYLLVLVQHRWIQWDAGWTPPPRFLVVVAPLLVPLVAEVFERRRGRALAAANTVWLVWSGASAFVLALLPFWRYNGLIGRATLLQHVGGRLGLDLARFLPSLRAPTPWTWAVLVLGALVVAGVARRSARSGHRGVRSWGLDAVVLPPGATVGLVLLIGGLWVGAAAVVPTWTVGAVAMHHSGGIQFGSYATQPILWVVQRDALMWEPIVTWPGWTRVTIDAGGLTTTGRAPRLTLVLDGRPVQTWTLEAGAGKWRQASYTAWVRTRFGRPVLGLRITDTLDQRRAPPPVIQHAYVERVRLRWAPGTAGPARDGAGRPGH
jgi:hypothetical protein